MSTEILTRIDIINKKAEGLSNELREPMEKRKRNTDKLNENENEESKLNQVIDDKVSDDVSVNDNYNGMTINKGDIIKNVVSESCILNNDSDDESLMGIEVSDEIVVVDEIESV